MVRKLCIALLVTAVATQTASAQTGKGGILNRMKSAVTRSQRSASSGGWRTHKSSYRSAKTKSSGTMSEVDRAVAVATGRIPATQVSGTKPTQNVQKPVVAPTPAAASKVVATPVSAPKQVPVQAAPLTRLAPTPDHMVPAQMAVPAQSVAHTQMVYGNAMSPMGYPIATGQYPRTSAALYSTPRPNIPYQVGMTQITNPAFAPHEMLYPHEYRAIYPPYYYKVRGGWLMTPFGVWSHEKWRPIGREVSVKYRSTISPFSGFVPPNN